MTQHDDDGSDDDLPALMTAREVAAAARMEVVSIRNRVHRGLDPQPVRRGTRGEKLLFRRDDVRRWLLGSNKGGRPQGGTR